MDIQPVPAIAGKLLPLMRVFKLTMNFKKKLRIVIRALHNDPLMLLLPAHYLTYRAREEQLYRLHSVYSAFLLCRLTIAELLQ